MSERSQHIRVGLIFILSVAVLIAGVLWFKNFRFGGQYLKVVVEFPTTSGLVRGDPVEVRGVPSGQVSRIQFEAGRALVTLDLDRKVRLTGGTRFVIENVGIMGQKLVAIYPGSEGTSVDPTSRVFTGVYQPGIPEFMSNLEGVLQSFDRLTNRLDALLAAFDESDQGSLRRTLKNSETITEDLAKFMSENREELGQAVRNLSAAMQDLHQTLDGREAQVDSLITASLRAATRADGALVSLQDALTRADSLMSRLDRGEGTMGKLVRDEDLYRELTGTLGETRALIRDIKADPKKYFKVSVF
jgi:phospholipid/cholesterol/gamma-HCH transport system substrate-binding protein